MLRITYLIITTFVVMAFTSCAQEQEKKANPNFVRAQQTLDSLYAHYGVHGSLLLRETYPFDSNHTATYLASEEQANIPNQYSYLWPFSGTLSAVISLMETKQELKCKKILENRVLPALESYFDSSRTPGAYASYLYQEPMPDRFYDDNVWLGIDFTDAYMLTKNPNYLEKAKVIWEFIESGTDDVLGGGIYWCEQKKGGKNTCSNAPGSVYAFKLFEATEDSSYFDKGKLLYEWTKQNLQDQTDYLYFDNINLKGHIGKAKFAYNSGQMMQSAALLYKLTGNKEYLIEAQNIAQSCYNHFFNEFTDTDGTEFKLLRKGDVWFTAVMLRGFIELYKLDNNPTYLETFNKNLDYAWNHSRDENGLFSTDWSGQIQDEKKWLLTQAAMVEMYARMANVNL